MLLRVVEVGHGLAPGTLGGGHGVHSGAARAAARLKVLLEAYSGPQSHEIPLHASLLIAGR